MKPSTFEKIYLVGLSVTAALFLGGSIVLMALPAAKADIYRADYVTAKSPNGREGVYLPSRFVNEERHAIEVAFPPQF